MHTFSHGIHPDDAKGLTEHKPIRRFPFAPYYVVHLSQNAGKPARSIVQAGQTVLRGQVIARADGFVSVPVHAPVTGTVKVVGTSFDFNGNPTPSIIIEPNPASHQEIEVKHPQDVSQLTPPQLVQAICDMGMVGLGGAAFPTHVKLTPPAGKEIHTVLLNGAECEPYLTSDHRVMLEQPREVLQGARFLLRAAKAQRVVIAIENNKADAISVLRRECRGDDRIQVEVFQTKYPQGAEKMLVKALLGKEVPSGGLPADIGLMIANISTAAEIGRLLPLGMGLVERVVTITGDGVADPGNYLIPIGTPLDFILKTVGAVREPYKVIFGGPMMGKTVAFLESPITKGTSGIIVLSGAGSDSSPRSHQEMFPCIRCGACVQACPMHLMPARLGLLARNGQYERMVEDYHLMDCFECGCCSYVCPSNIPLVQQFRMSKQIVRQRMTNHV